MGLGPFTEDIETYFYLFFGLSVERAKGPWHYCHSFHLLSFVAFTYVIELLYYTIFLCSFFANINWKILYLNCKVIARAILVFKRKSIWVVLSCVTAQCAWCKVYLDRHIYQPCGHARGPAAVHLPLASCLLTYSDSLILSYIKCRKLDSFCIQEKDYTII